MSVFSNFLFIHTGAQGFVGMKEEAVFVFFNLLLEGPEHACMHKQTEQTEPER